MSFYQIESAIRAGDVAGLRAFCQTSTSDPPMYPLSYVQREWWNLVRERLQLNHPQQHINTIHNLVEVMDRMPKDRLDELGWVKQLNDIEKTFVHMMEILKTHNYLPSTPVPYYVEYFISSHNYGLAKAYVDLFQPETCNEIKLGMHLLNESLEAKLAGVRYDEDKEAAVVDAFVAHCHRSVPDCTVQDVVHGREFTPLLQKCIDKRFRNPNLFEKRKALIELKHDIEAHNKGKPLSRDPIADYLTDLHMNKDIHQYIGDYSPPPHRRSPHSQEPSSPHSQEHRSKKRKTTRGGKRTTMARRRKGMRGYTRKQNQGQGQGQGRSASG